MASPAIRLGFVLGARGQGGVEWSLSQDFGGGMVVYPGGGLGLVGGAIYESLLGTFGIIAWPNVFASMRKYPTAGSETEG